MWPVTKANQYAEMILALLTDEAPQNTGKTRGLEESPAN